MKVVTSAFALLHFLPNTENSLACSFVMSGPPNGEDSFNSLQSYAILSDIALKKEKDTAFLITAGNIAMSLSRVLNR